MQLISLLIHLPQRRRASVEIIDRSSPFRIVRDIERPVLRAQSLSHVSEREKGGNLDAFDEEDFQIRF